MKKFILKGKQFLSKKLQQLDLASDNIDLVSEQIPHRLKGPLKVIRRNDIDLQSNEQYETYYKNYPNHHISHFLLEKYQLLLSANTPSPQLIMPFDTKDTFIPKFQQELENKGLLFKDVVEQYDQGYQIVQDPIVCIAVIHFHHKRGTEIQYTYPKNKNTESIQNLIVHHAMPDSSHNKNEDYNFFNFQTTVKGKPKMLFGVSYFKQIKVTEQMKEMNKQLTRSYIQKAVAVVSSLPLFGYLKLRLASTTKIFFQNFLNYEIIDLAYKDLSKHLNETWPQMPINQLYIGSDLKTIINLFGVSQFYQIWKAILYQKRVVVFAHSSSSASSFILSLLTLFPGMSTFGIYSKSISKFMQSLREYALPLRLFSSQNFMSMSFHIQDFHLLSKFQKSQKGSFLLGTTNRLLKEANDYGIQLLINLQNCTIEKKKPRIPWEPLSKRQKQFISQLREIIEIQKSLGYDGSEDMIRNHFHKFLKIQLLQIMKSIQSFRAFLQECKAYEKKSENTAQNQHSNKSNKSEQYQVMEQQNQQYFGSKKMQFPPVIPQQVLSIPFPNLLLCSSFSYFLQFHNEKLPLIVQNKIFPSLLIEGYEYYLKIDEQRFVLYNWLDKKLVLGKGKPKSFEGKQLRFVNEGNELLTVKSMYLGMIQNNRPEKNGFFIDKSQTYQGDYSNGLKKGYGKLKNSLHKYIGNFNNNLYEGQGQLLTGKQIYVGEFKQGMRHGVGKNQGQFNYDGEWANNKAQGNGIWKVNQHEYIGSFQKGQLNEELEVTIRYENGSMYKGYVKNGLPEGRGYLVDEKGKLFSGLFKNGKFFQAMEVSNIEINNLTEAEQKESNEKQGQNTANTVSEEKTIE